MTASSLTSASRPHDVSGRATIAETVFVLGAGASQADGVPIQNALMHQFWQIASHPKRLAGGKVSPALRKYVIEPLRQFFQGFFWISKDALANDGTLFPTFEEAFAILDFALARDEEFPELDRHWIADRRVNLANLIALTLIHSQESTSPTRHLQLLTGLARSGRLENTAFVSFNYDLLLDRAVASVASHDRTYYGFAIRYCNGHARAPTHLESSVTLLKPHGSLNFAYCPTCRSVDCGGLKEIASNLIPGAGSGTPFCRCGSVKQPLVVPPTFFKSFASLQLQQTWALAEETFQHARRIVFCGYSFPESDIWFKYVLKRAQLRGQAEGLPGPKVLVANHHKKKISSQRDEELRRYQRFLGPHVPVVSPDGLGFEEVASDPTGVLRLLD